MLLRYVILITLCLGAADSSFSAASKTADQLRTYLSKKLGYTKAFSDVEIALIQKAFPAVMPTAAQIDQALDADRVTAEIARRKLEAERDAAADAQRRAEEEASRHQVARLQAEEFAAAKTEGAQQAKLLEMQRTSREEVARAQGEATAAKAAEMRARSELEAARAGSIESNGAGNGAVAGTGAAAGPAKSLKPEEKRQALLMAELGNKMKPSPGKLFVPVMDAETPVVKGADASAIRRQEASDAKKVMKKEFEERTLAGLPVSEQALKIEAGLVEAIQTLSAYQTLNATKNNLIIPSAARKSGDKDKISKLETTIAMLEEILNQPQFSEQKTAIKKKIKDLTDTIIKTKKAEGAPERGPAGAGAGAPVLTIEQKNAKIERAINEENLGNMVIFVPEADGRIVQKTVEAVNTILSSAAPEGDYKASLREAAIRWLDFAPSLMHYENTTMVTATVKMGGAPEALTLKEMRKRARTAPIPLQPAIKNAIDKAIKEEIEKADDDSARKIGVIFIPIDADNHIKQMTITDARDLMLGKHDDEQVILRDGILRGLALASQMNGYENTLNVTVKINPLSEQPKPLGEARKFTKAGPIAQPNKEAIDKAIRAEIDRAIRTESLADHIILIPTPDAEYITQMKASDAVSWLNSLAPADAPTVRLRDAILRGIALRPIAQGAGGGAGSGKSGDSKASNALLAELLAKTAKKGGAGTDAVAKLEQERLAAEKKRKDEEAGAAAARTLPADTRIAGTNYISGPDAPSMAYEDIPDTEPVSKHKLHMAEMSKYARNKEVYTIAGPAGARINVHPRINLSIRRLLDNIKIHAATWDQAALMHTFEEIHQAFAADKAAHKDGDIIAIHDLVNYVCNAEIQYLADGTVITSHINPALLDGSFTIRFQSVEEYPEFERIFKLKGDVVARQQDEATKKADEAAWERLQTQAYPDVDATRQPAYAHYTGKDRMCPYLLRMSDDDLRSKLSSFSAITGQGKVTALSTGWATCSIDELYAIRKKWGLYFGRAKKEGFGGTAEDSFLSYIKTREASRLSSAETGAPAIESGQGVKWYTIVTIPGQ